VHTGTLYIQKPIQRGYVQMKKQQPKQVSKLTERLELIKAGEKKEAVPSGFNAGDVVVLAGEKKGDKLILAGRKAVVVGDSKAVGKVQCILIEKNSNELQNCVITQLADSMTKIGRYTDEGEIIIDEETSK
jgi:5,10-methylene-tetrahydrofolate dehydrogenase/methenyl tetrahydrofolate cyclohydrolase